MKYLIPIIIITTPILIILALFIFDPLKVPAPVEPTYTVEGENETPTSWVDPGFTKGEK